MKIIYIKTAGFINLFGAILHTIGGQIELVNPLLDSNLSTQQIAELTGAWHIVNILLFFTSYVILRSAFKNSINDEIQRLKSIGILYILSGIPFIATSFWYGVSAVQWILLMPAGILLFIGLHQQSNKHNTQKTTPVISNKAN